MPIILLIRHGENEYVRKGRLAGRKPGVHLNENGRKQAETLAAMLAKAPIKAVYSSPLERTMETAAPIAKSRGLKVIERPGLLELDFGDWQDKTLKSLRRRKLWKTVQGRPSMMRFPNGESFSEAQQRVAAELEALVAMHKPKDMFVCVAHSDLIKLALAYYLGLPLDLFQRLMVAPASISTLHIGEGSAQLINLNFSPSMSFHGTAGAKKKKADAKGRAGRGK
jgi:probable phosphomutase (TIGR03848 family)